MINFFPSDDKPQHIKSLDGLRGLAVLIVFFAHLSNSKIHGFPYFKGLGQTGVYLFFILSAYLLDKQVYNAILQKKSNLNYWTYYFSRRFLRIFPLFIISMFLYLYLDYCDIPFRIKIIDLNDIKDHLLFRRAEGVYWSIPVEFKFYFISPLIMLFCYHFLKNRFIYITIFMIIVMAISLYLAKLGYQRHTLSTSGYLQIFLFGSWLVIFEKQYSSFIENLSNFQKKVLDSAGIICLFLLFIINGTYFAKLFAVENIYELFRYNYFFQGIQITILLSAVLYANGITKKIFENKLIRFIGIISYSFYLFHLPFIQLMKHSKFPIADDFLKVFLAFLLSVIFCTITYLLIENRFNKIKIPKFS